MLRKEIAELYAAIEIAKRECLAGILRAQNELNKRRPPYHKGVAIMLFCLLVFGRVHAQTTREGILIDTSGSISKGGASKELFREYLLGAHKLLLTLPASSRVWVSGISTDSFGGVEEILKGWTPDARGVFTDDLNRARHQLATTFEKKSAEMTPVASGTDIFGALWRMKALLESDQQNTSSTIPTRTIWIFSDMMNETSAFPMPTLIQLGPQQMLERAKAASLIIPLQGYKVYVYGASPSGVAAQTWVAVKSFWTLYFSAAGAKLVVYSPETSPER
jgi:hypothetical protein